MFRHADRKESFGSFCRKSAGEKQVHLLRLRCKKQGFNRFPISFSKRPTVNGSKKEMSIDNRMRCLQDLKSTGFQTCGGFMVGRPHQAPQVFVNSKTGEVQELLLQSRCENEE